MLRKSLLTIFIILFVDQFTKIYIKTHFYLGQEVDVLGDWFKLCFVENEGMAFGATLPIPNAKLILSSFRVVAVGALAYYLWTIIRDQSQKLYIISMSLIFAGALGNIIDSVFYGFMFEESAFHLPIASSIFSDDFQGGYAGVLYGNVVDMLYFPIFNGTYPEWIPKIGGDRFTFFSPIFNIADAAITVGVAIILLYQKRFFPKEKDQSSDNVTEENTDSLAAPSAD